MLAAPDWSWDDSPAKDFLERAQPAVELPRTPTGGRRPGHHHTKSPSRLPMPPRTPTTPKSLDIFDPSPERPTTRHSPERSVSHSTTPSTRRSVKLHDDASRSFLLGKCIGKGQFGRVYQAFDTSTGRLVAVKSIELKQTRPWSDRRPQHDNSRRVSAALAGGTPDVEEIMREIELLKACEHRHVVKYIGFGESGGSIDGNRFLDIVTDYVEGGSLADVIRHFGTLPESLACSYTWQVLDALQFVHARDIIHCDIKSANLLVTKRGCIKLSDFGVSIRISDQATTIKGLVQGTPNWLAPEIISLRGTSKASDIWAVGCCILEMLTGLPPYATCNAMTAMFRIVEDDHPPLPEDASEEMRGLLLRIFQKEPRDRPSAADLKDVSIIREQGLKIATAIRPSTADTILVSKSSVPLHAGQASAIESRLTREDILAIPTNEQKRLSMPLLPRPELTIHNWTDVRFKHKTKCALCRHDLSKGQLCMACKTTAHSKCVVERHSWCKAGRDLVKDKAPIVASDSVMDIPICLAGVNIPRSRVAPTLKGPAYGRLSDRDETHACTIM